MFKEEDKILELNGKIIKLQEELHKVKQENKEIKEKYLNLRCRYTNQNDELCRLKIQISKEGNNDNKRS
jgi:hypothetical protein